ncbi:MAG TPA: XRE family transcriptional regulator [Euzebyales bacterium]|nr:XRE family transcriptional regulator [Euzebyales bacterium]
MTPQTSDDPYLSAMLADAEAGRVDEGELETLIDDLGGIVGERVREFRMSLNLTVADLADLTGISKAMLSKVENNRTSASLSTLARLSTALGVPITALFRGLDEDHEVVFVKSGQGLALSHERPKPGADYRLLGMLRGQHQRLEPVLVTFNEPIEHFPLYQHGGSELIYMIYGTMEYGCGRSRYLLEAGDVLQFQGNIGHGATQLMRLPIQFLSIKAYGNVRDPVTAPGS